MTMANRNPETAWQYHRATKHSHWSVRNNLHYLDWSNQPLLFKIYRDLEPLPLPTNLPRTDVPALTVLADADRAGPGEAVPDLRTLAYLLYFSAGITKRKQYPGGDLLFRAAACTGALYEIELYLVCADLVDLPAGVYHFSPADFALRRLRAGDHRGLLVRATGNEPAVSSAPVTIICTGTYWRNAWKYQARTYRHFGWDNGTLLANLLAACNARELPARVVGGFVDREVNRLLDLDTEREVAFSLIPVGRLSETPPPAPPELPPLNLQTAPLSREEVDYPAMRQIHAASSLDSPEEAAVWRGTTPELDWPTAGGKRFPLEPSSEKESPPELLEQVILRRGSSRQFAREPLTFPQLSTLLHCAGQGLAADFLEPFGAHLNQMYLIIHAVEGLPPGKYLYRDDQNALELLAEGEFRQQAYYLGLEQELPGDAGAAVFFLCDLQRVLKRFGNRGYRAAQLEAGILGGRMYLAAYAQRLGATGLTFYDDDVIKFFSPHADGKSTIFLTAAGHRVRRRLVNLR